MTTPRGLDSYAQDPIGFIDRFIARNEKGQPWTLSPYQRTVLRLAFRFDLVTGRLLLRLLLWGESKKAGKTFLAACLTLWWAFVTPSTEVIIAANDLDQSVGRVFATIVALIAWNPELQRSTTVQKTTILVSNGTSIKAIPSDYAGAAGSRHTLAVVDELWAFSGERAHRLVEELTPIPTEPSAWMLVVTTAGFTSESDVLEAMYARGIAGERLDDDLEVFQAHEQITFWSRTPRQPWLTREYYEQQARTLRPNTFARLHRNEWVSAESTFITPEMWDGCVVPGLTPVLVDPGLAVTVGVDGALKHDTAAIVAVAWHGPKLRVVAHRIWTPTPGTPLDLETTIEAELRLWRTRFTVRRIVCDPWQLARSIATLKAAGLPIEEFPQTQANLTRAGSALFDVLTGRNLMLYADAALRTQALNAVAIESVRGTVRIAKETARQKIDSTIALAMAVAAAIEARGAEHHGPLSATVHSDYGRGAPDWATRRAAELLAESRAARQAVHVTEDDALRALVRSAQPPHPDPLAGLKKLIAERGVDEMRRVFVDVCGAGAVLPDCLRESTTGLHRG